MGKKQERPYSRRDFMRAGSVAAAVTAGMAKTAWPETVAVPRAQRASASSQQSGKVSHEIVNLKAEDGRGSRGVFYHLEGSTPRVVILSMHPVGDSTQDWRSVPMTQRGIAYFGMAGRYVRNEAHHIHEELVLDVAAGVKYLKEERGIPTVILLGHSGGGQLMALYHSQAVTSPPDRIRSTPAGDPPDLNQYTLIPADSMILSAAHPGRSVIFRMRLDAAVVEESDSLSTDPNLDMFDPRNGFRKPPESSKYSADFLERYEAGQHARMQRLDAKARSLIAREKFYQKLVEAPDFKQRPLSEQLNIERQAIECHWMVIHRSSADPRFTDLSLDPNDRLVGSNQGPFHFRPDLENYSIFRGPQMISPRAFLSSRSTVSANNKMWDNLRKVTIPLLVICGTADRNETPILQRRNLESARSRDRSIIWIVGADHPYNPSGPKAGNGGQREEAADRMADWVKKRFQS